MNLPNSISGQIPAHAPRSTLGSASRLVRAGRLVIRTGWLAGVALAWLALGCGGATDAPVTFTEIKPLIRTSCALSSSCHAASSNYSGSLSLAEADAYCSLVGATKGATYRDTAKAQYPHRVVAGDKASSFLYQKLTLSTTDSGSAKPLGTVMPLNQPLDDANINLFARWIDGGAQNETGTAAPAGCN